MGVFRYIVQGFFLRWIAFARKREESDEGDFLSDRFRIGGLEEGYKLHGATRGQKPALNEFRGRRYQRGSRLCDEEDLDRGSLRRNRWWWVNRLRRWKGINCERKMTRRDVHEGATRTTANDTNIPELVRDVLDWPACEGRRWGSWSGNGWERERTLAARSVWMKTKRMIE